MFVFSSSGLVIANGQTLEPTDTHIVSLYVDGNELTVPSRAKTVDEFLRATKVGLGEFDIVEPSLDQLIDADMFRIRVIRARPYTVYDRGDSYSVLSAHSTPKLIAQSAISDLSPADTAQYRSISELSQTSLGREIEIMRAKRINLVLYGSLQTVRTTVSTVGELLSELNVSPAPDDEVSAPDGAMLGEDMTLSVSRKGIKVIVEEQVIEPSVEYIQDEGLTIGSMVVRDPGSAGKKVVIYEIISENGQEVGSRVISSAITVQPTQRIVARGRAAGQISENKTQLLALAGVREDEFAAADYIITRESGWCATRWQHRIATCPQFYEEKFPGAEIDKELGYGLCQSTPAIKMASAGDDWRTNPVTQLKWCTNYARNRYGDWNKAYEKWVIQKWW